MLKLCSGTPAESCSRHVEAILAASLSHNTIHRSIGGGGIGEPGGCGGGIGELGGDTEGSSFSPSFAWVTRLGIAGGAVAVGGRCAGQAPACWQHFDAVINVTPQHSQVLSLHTLLVKKKSTNTDTRSAARACRRQSLSRFPPTRHCRPTLPLPLPLYPLLHLQTSTCTSL
jgi:hypothetical protein